MPNDPVVYIVALLSGGLAYMILREVFKFLLHRPGGSNGHGKVSVHDLILDELKKLNTNLNGVPDALGRIESRQHKAQTDRTEIQHTVDALTLKQEEARKVIDRLAS